MEQLTAADPDREQRQLGVVDAAGRGATFTGSGCHAWAGGPDGAGYAAQGNILVSAETVAASRSVRDDGRAPLADRLLGCLAAAQAAGGDRRGQQSAALLVVERDGGYAGLSDTLVDLRVDEHAAADRRAAAALRDPPGAVRGDRPRGSGSRSTTRSRGRDRRAAGTARVRTLAEWAGVENLEERVDGEGRDRSGRARRLAEPVVSARCR